MSRITGSVTGFEPAPAMPRTSPAITFTRTPSSVKVGISAAGMSRYVGALILSLAGRFSQSWKPCIWLFSCSGISEWTTPRAAVIHWTPPAETTPSWPALSPVPYAPGEHVRHSLEAAVRMIGEARDVFLRIVRAERVEQQERVETALQIVGEDTRQPDARAVGRRLPGHLAFDLPRATDHGCWMGHRTWAASSNERRGVRACNRERSP